MIRTLLCLSMALAAAPALLAQTEVVNWSTGVSYTYDGSESVAAIGNDRFVYDDVGRLVQAEVNSIKQNYTYDAFGNRTECAQTNPSADCKFTWTINATNNRIGNASYDGRGNLTALGPHNYTYDTLDMMTGDQSASFLYTADDQRIATYGGGTWRWTIRDTGSKILREFTSQDGNGQFGQSAWTWKKDYIWRDAKLLASRQREGEATTTYHYHLDHLGTPRRITDQKDAVVDWRDFHAFGREVAGKKETAPNTIRYTGQERDDWGDQYTLDYMHARYYNPAAGRFFSVDPSLDVTEAAHEPQLWNRYAYVTNNPVTYTDPDGRYRTFYKEKPLREADVAHAPPVIKACFMIEGGLLLLPAAGEAGWAALNSLALRAFTAFPRLFLWMMGIGAGMTGAPSTPGPAVNLGSGGRPIPGAINVDNVGPGFQGSMQQIQVAGDALALPFKNGSLGNVTAMNFPSQLLGQGGSQFAGELARTMKSGSTLTITTRTPGVLTSFAKLIEKAFTDVVVKDNVLTAVRR